MARKYRKDDMIGRRDVSVCKPTRPPILLSSVCVRGVVMCGYVYSRYQLGCRGLDEVLSYFTSKQKNILNNIFV